MVPFSFSGLVIIIKRMKYFFILMLMTGSAFASPDAVEEFLKGQKLDSTGSFTGLETKPAPIYLNVRNQTVYGVVDYVHATDSTYTISFHGLYIIKSMEPLLHVPYPAYSVHLRSKAELEKRKQVFQSYGAVSTEEGNGFCRAAFGSEYHVVSQNPTASRKTENDPWYLESVTCEGPRPKKSPTP
jgi:hypothetical protein